VTRSALPVGALLVAATAASAQQFPQAHMEGCLAWGESNGRIGARNECGRPLTVLFMEFDDPQKLEVDVAAGGWFDPGIAVGGGSYMFTACPVGYRPSVRFALENKTVIVESLYNCVPGRPNS
jgi:hypothetical protein